MAAESGTETKRTFCRFCHASCAMIVEVENDKIKSVKGDPDDHLFHGYTCIKGRQMPDMHNLDTRMITSKIRQPDGSFKDIIYTDLSRNAGFPQRRHVSDLAYLAKAYQTPTSKFHRSEPLKKTITLGFRYWGSPL